MTRIFKVRGSYQTMYDGKRDSHVENFAENVVALNAKQAIEKVESGLKKPSQFKDYETKKTVKVQNYNIVSTEVELKAEA